MKEGYPSTRKPYFVRVLCLFLLLSFLPGNSTGQNESNAKYNQVQLHEDYAPVYVDGIILFKVRGVTSYPAKTRAAIIGKRLIHAAENRSLHPDSIKAIPLENKISIYAGNEFIMNVYSVDAELEEIDQKLESEIFVGKIKDFIRQYRAERTPPVIKQNAVRAGIAFLFLIISLAIFIFIFRKLNTLFKRRVKHRIDKLENVSYKLIQSDHLIKVLEVFYRAIRAIIIALITIGFINYILSLFPWTRAVSRYLMELVVDPIKVIGTSFFDYLPSLIFLIFIILVTRYILKLVHVFFISIENEGITLDGFDPEWAMPTYKIIKFLVIVFALVVAFPYIPGSGTGAFQGISVFLGVLFSLGSSSFISNVIAGYSMTYRRAFKKGDRIQVNELNGFVEEQSLMVTRLRSVKNEEIVIPNSILLNSSVVNFSARAKKQGVILYTTVGIGYETPWRQVDSMLKLAADRTTGLLKDPPPFVLKKELGDFAVTYEINAYCDTVDRMYLYYTALHEHILDIFNENNVQIMTPNYEMDPVVPKVVPKEQWNTPLANPE